MRSNQLKTICLWGAIAAAVVVTPVPFIGTAAVYGDTYEELAKKIADTERETADENARFAQEVSGISKSSRAYKQASDKRDVKLKEIRGRREKLKDQAEKARSQVSGKAVAEKLDATGDLIAAEKKRHAEAMKNIPSGSMAAQQENQRYEDRLKSLRDRRDDVKESVQSAKEVKQSTEIFKKDKKALETAIAAENSRHSKAMRYLPANSPQAMEEDRFHAQRLREINDGVEAAADRRDATLTKLGADKQVDADLDAVNAQIAQEKTRHERRNAQVNAGSVAAAEEQRLYSENMARLSQRQAELQNRSANAKSAADQKFALKRQLDEIELALAKENDRFNRRLNDIDAGSEQERLERERHARAVAELNSRRGQVVAQLN